MDTLLKDLRYSLRTLSRSRGFAVVAVLTLALGIAANTAVFSVVNGVLLRPLPYRDADRLVRIYPSNLKEGFPQGAFSPNDFDDVVRDAGVFHTAAAYFFVPQLTGTNLTGQGDPLRLDIAYVSEGFFGTLGVAPLLGRWTTREEHVRGAGPVVMLSHGLWRGRFGGDAGIVGKAITIDGRPFTVVGVMPPSFQFPSAQPAIWVPLSILTDNDVPHRRDVRWLGAVGRLRPGVTIEQASAATNGVMARLEKQHPESNEGWGGGMVQSLEDSLVGNVRPALLVMLGAVALVLLIACANIANLLLARATGRSREVAIRLAMGADRARLLRQFLTESVVLGLVGGALGLGLAYFGIDALMSLGADQIARYDEVRADGAVLGYTLLISGITGLIFGLLPALRSAGSQPHDALREGVRGGTGRRAHGVRGLLVVAESALAVMLLIGAGLLVRSFWELTHVDPGFRSENVLTANFTVPSDQFEESAFSQIVQYRNRVLDRVRQIPGVIAAGASKTVPLHGGGEPFEYTVDLGESGTAEVTQSTGYYIVSPGYFEALGIPLLSGRTFTDEDERRPTVGIVVSRAFVEKIWPGQNAVGKFVRALGGDIEILGVVGDVRQEGLAEAAPPAVYIHGGLAPRISVNLFVRTEGNPLSLVNALRQAIWEVNPNQPVANIMTMPQLVSSTVAQPRFFTLLLGIFSGLALLLAAVGLYGVLSYAVGERTREIGVRMALGARPSDVLRQVVGQALGMAALGVAVGIGGALALTQVMSSLLFGVTTTDTLTFVAVPLFLLLAALLAGLLPARRATRVDPMVALRHE